MQCIERILQHTDYICFQALNVHQNEMITVVSAAFPHSTHLYKLGINLQEKESTLPVEGDHWECSGGAGTRGEAVAGAYFVGEHRFEAPAEVAEVIPVLVHLHALTVVLDLGVHPVGTLLHGILDGLAGLSLGHTGTNTWKIKLLLPKVMNELKWIPL